MGLKQSIEKGIIPGPRMLVVTRAIVATGSYGPKRTDSRLPVPQGAEEADAANLVRVVRSQIGAGADWVKVYADYRWGPGKLGRADIFGGRTQTHRHDGPIGGMPGLRPRHHGRRGAGARRWPASKRSSTATKGRPRSSR